jgi:alpha-amylase
MLMKLEISRPSALAPLVFAAILGAAGCAAHNPPVAPAVSAAVAAAEPVTPVPADPAPAEAVAAAAPRAGAEPWQHDWARGAVFYEVFVRSFADSNGDGKGDFNGLTAKLDYLNDGDPATTTDLGVDALWLMPVFASPSYHGYDVTDYGAIEPDYGTEQDFERFLLEAHRRGIRVIVDLVLNHTSSKHPWFVDAASSPTARHRDWYVWRDQDPGWRQPWGANGTWHAAGGAFYYGLFWGGMPDLNWRNPEVRAEMAKVAESWLRRGVDGFRLDATRHLVEDDGADGKGVLFDAPETHEALREFAARVRAVNPQAVLVGENWTETPQIARYFGATDRVAGGDELPMNFNFPLASAVVEGIESEEAAGIAEKLEEMAELYPPGVVDTPFLTNHDQVRLATQLGDDPARLRTAAAILLTLPGAPFLYYGEELGLDNGPGGQDEQKRTPMPWDATPGGGFTTSATPWFAFAPGRESRNVAAETGDPGSLLAHYRRLIATRHAFPALRRGSLELLTRGDVGSPVLAFLRKTPEQTVLVAHNLGQQEATVGPYLPEVTILTTQFATEGDKPRVAKGPDGWRIRLPAGASAIFTPGEP